jgi:hypothetical protein
MPTISAPNRTGDPTAPTGRRSALAAGIAAVVLATGAVAIFGSSGDSDTDSVSLNQPVPADVRYDGGPNEGAAVLSMSRVQQQPASAQRYDGGPNDGTAVLSMGHVRQYQPMSAQRYDGGPNEGSAGPFAGR